MITALESSKLLVVSASPKPFRINSQGQRAGTLVTTSKGPEGVGSVPEYRSRGREEAPGQQWSLGSYENSPGMVVPEKGFHGAGAQCTMIKECEPETLDPLFLSVFLLLDSTVTRWEGGVGDTVGPLNHQQTKQPKKTEKHNPAPGGHS